MGIHFSRADSEEEDVDHGEVKYASPQAHYFIPIFAEPRDETGFGSLASDTSHAHGLFGTFGLTQFDQKLFTEISNIELVKQSTRERGLIGKAVSQRKPEGSSGAAVKVSLSTASYPSIFLMVEEATPIPPLVDFMRLSFYLKSVTWGQLPDGQISVDSPDGAYAARGLTKSSPPVPLPPNIKGIYPNPTLFSVMKLNGYNFSVLNRLPTTNSVTVKHTATILILDLTKQSAVAVVSNFLSETTSLLLHGSIYELTNVDVYVLFLNCEKLDQHQVLTKQEVLDALGQIGINNIFTFDLPINHHSDWECAPHESSLRLLDSIWESVYRAHFALHQQGRFDFCHPPSPFSPDQLIEYTDAILRQEGGGLENNPETGNGFTHPILTSPLQFPPPSLQSIRSFSLTMALNSMPMLGWDELDDELMDERISASFLSMIHTIENTWSTHCPLQTPGGGKSKDGLFRFSDDYYNERFFKSAFRYQYHQWFHHFRRDTVLDQLIEAHTRETELDLRQKSIRAPRSFSSSGYLTNLSQSAAAQPQVLPLFGIIYPYTDPRAFYPHRLSFLSTPHPLPLIVSNHPSPSKPFFDASTHNNSLQLPSIYRHTMSIHSYQHIIRSIVDDQRNNALFCLGSEIGLEYDENENETESSLPRIFQSRVNEPPKPLDQQSSMHSSLLAASSGSGEDSKPGANTPEQIDLETKLQPQPTALLDLSSLPQRHEFESFILWDTPIISDPYYILPQSYALSPYSTLYKEIEAANQHSKSRLYAMKNTPQVMQSLLNPAKVQQGRHKNLNQAYSSYCDTILDNVDTYMCDKYFTLPRSFAVGGYHKMPHRVPSLLTLIHPPDTSDRGEEDIAACKTTLSQPLTFCHSRISWEQPLSCRQLNNLSRSGIHYIPKPFEITPSIQHGRLVEKVDSSQQLASSSPSTTTTTTRLSCDLPTRVKINMTYTYFRAGKENFLPQHPTGRPLKYFTSPLSHMTEAAPLPYLYGVWVVPFVYTRRSSEMFVKKVACVVQNSTLPPEKLTESAASLFDLYFHQPSPLPSGPMIREYDSHSHFGSSNHQPPRHPYLAQYPDCFVAPPIPFFDFQALLTPFQSSPLTKTTEFHNRKPKISPKEARLDVIQGATSGLYTSLNSIQSMAQLNCPITFVALCLNPVVADPVPYHENLDQDFLDKVSQTNTITNQPTPFISPPEEFDPYEQYVELSNRGPTKPTKAWSIRPSTPAGTFEPITLSQFTFFQKHFPVLNKNHLIHGMMYPTQLTSVDKMESMWDVQFHHVNNFTPVMEQIEQRAIEHRIRLYHANAQMFAHKK